MADLSTLPKRAKWLRRRYSDSVGRRVTQIEVADAAGMGRSTLTGIETGHQGASTGTLTELAMFYRVNVHWLACGEGEIEVRMPELGTPSSDLTRRRDPVAAKVADSVPIAATAFGVSAPKPTAADRIAATIAARWATGIGEAGSALKMSPAALLRIERGVAKLPDAKLAQLCGLVGCGIEWIVDGDPASLPQKILARIVRSAPELVSTLFEEEKSQAVET